MSTVWAAEPKGVVAPTLEKAPDLSQGLKDPASAKALTPEEHIVRRTPIPQEAFFPQGDDIATN